MKILLRKLPPASYLILLTLLVSATLFLPAKAFAADSTDTVRVRGFNDALISIPKPSAGATRTVSMLQLQPRTVSNTATWTAVHVSRIGNSNNAWVNSVKIYSATSTAEFDPNYNTLIGSGAIDTTISLSTVQVITTSPTGYYFIVFELNDQATLGGTIGARIADQGRFIVDAPDGVRAFKNLDSKRSTFVGEPHGSPGNVGAYVNTNYCSACHNIHMARQNRRILNKLYTSDASVVNNNSANVYNALCFSCHDGTGSSKNIQADYDAVASSKQKGPGDDSGPVVSPGHMTDQTGTIAGGYLAGTNYDNETELPCMICHDVHQSKNNNYAMIADGLYNFASSPAETTDTTTEPYWWDSSATVWGSSATDNYTRNKRCEVCHRNAVGSADTTSTSGTGSYLDGKSVVVGIDLGRPSTHDTTGSKGTDWCGSCHGVHKITVDQADFGAESAGNVACDECHQASVVAPMQDASTYHHYLQNAGVSNLLSSGTKYPTKSSFNSSETTSTERRCLMCHADHDVFSPATGAIRANGDRAKNLRASVAIVPTAGATSSFSDSDFDANQTQGGICVSCHSVSQTKNTVNQKFLPAEDETQTMVVNKAEYAEATTAHNYEATSTFPGRVYDNGANQPFEFRANCVKCHNTIENNNYPYSTESDVGSKQDSQFRFQMHANKLRRLLAWLNIMSQDTSQDPLEENFCNRCHGGADNPNFGAGKDYYNRVSMAVNARDIKSVITTSSVVSNHPVGGASRKRHKAVEGQSPNWNPATNRHVECEDCHNVHAAKAIDNNNPVRGGPQGADVGNTEKGVWGITPSGYSAYTTGTARFVQGSNTVTGTATSWSSSNVSAGWYIKSNYDMDGRWYKISVANYVPQTLTLSQNFNGTRAYFDGATSTSVEYTAVDVTYAKTNTSTYEYEICLKCHSKYSFDDTAPDMPSGDATTASSVKETDIGHDFNTEQMAIHPVTALGKNQPWRADQLEMSGSANWPLYASGTVIATAGSATITGSGTNWLNMAGSGKSTIRPGWLIKFGAETTGGPLNTSWYQVASVLSNTTMTLTGNYGGATGSKTYKLGAGLGNAFVPPWGPWSRMVCSDCHGNDDDAGPSGPHGSAQRWVLKETTTALSFDWFNGTSIQTLTPNNAAVGAGTAATATKAIFCFNCHRRDVYGDVGLTVADANNADTTVTDALMSRISHNPTSETTTYASAHVNNWGILCMNCHGGDSVGGLHGATRFRGRNASNGTSDTAMQYSGKRLLNGATLVGVKRPTTSLSARFWTKKGLSYPVPDEVNVSNQSLNGTNGDTATYDYDITNP